jgi:hypothetical protein
VKFNMINRTAHRAVVVVALVAALLVPAIKPALAQHDDGVPDTVALSEHAQGVYLEWPQGVAAASAVEQLPSLHYQGYELPLQLVTLQVVEGAEAVIDLAQFSASNWDAPLLPTSLPPPPVLDGELLIATEVAGSASLPDSPVFVVRQGQVFGQSIIVVAISPLFEDAGQVKLVNSVGATIHNAKPLTGSVAEFLASAQAEMSATVRAATAADALAPTNPLASQPAIKLFVTQPGIQQVSGQALAAAGLDLAAVNPTALVLLQGGNPVPLELDGLAGGRLVASSTMRFYAPTAGDRWNVETVYWLALDPAGGPRMATRTVTPAGAAPRTTVVERGVWQVNQVYASRLPGIDGDHWFHQELKVSSSTPPPSISFAPNNVLPAVSGPATYSITLSTRSPATFTLQVLLDSTAETWHWRATPGNAQTENLRRSVTSSTPVQNITLTLLETEGGYGDVTLWLDQMPWSQVALLDLRQAGAAFRGEEGFWHYQWQNAPQATPGGYSLYDISDPAAPIALHGADATGFQDGPTAAAYLVAGAGTLHEPVVRSYLPIALPQTGAQAVYIAPGAFIPALEPLLAQRRSQGYTAVAVDVQQIYDAWSYGQVSAEAIRTFLRFARATWEQPPIAVTLVGDGTWDPHNYESKAHFTNYMPPYVAQVDPWLGEAACDNCYGQLDGDDPLIGDQQAGSPTAFFAADLWVGRLPVKSASELAALVNKILRYENEPGSDDWRNVSLFLADNYIKRLDDTGTPVRDMAGDFARLSDLIIRRILCARVGDPVLCSLTGANSDSAVTGATLNQQISTLMGRSALRLARYYYDPFPSFSDPEGTQMWRTPNPKQLRESALAALSHGAGLVVYAGHSNHWQWGVLDGEGNLPLVTLNDPDALANRDRLFIALSMTCLTAQFHKPADSGTTLDERFLLAPNGAVAVWGPAGLSVVHGHDALQRGFFQTLWRAEPGSLRLGELVAGGYFELLTNSLCCQDVLRTYVLLGDPLTPARIQPLEVAHLPLVNR